MTNQGKRWRRVVRVSAAALLSSVLASSCSTEDVQRAVAGLDAVVNYEQNQREAGFTDWLNQEIEHWF